MQDKEEKEKTIFYFEDDPYGLKDHVEILRENYEVSIGAHKNLVEQPREKAVDLVIVDLMIHLESYDLETDMEVENIKYPDVPWIRTGLKFIQRLRKGDYEDYGFPKDVYVIIATAVVDHTAKEDSKKYDISEILEKPFKIDELETAVKKIFSPEP